MIYAFLVFNDVNPKYQSKRQTKESLDSYIEVLSNNPEQVNETAVINSHEGARFRYSQGSFTLEEGSGPKESIRTIVFLDCENFNAALALVNQFKVAENSVVELRPAIIINRTTEALSED